MRIKRTQIAAWSLTVLAVLGAPRLDERVKNDLVIVTEVSLHPNETETLAGTYPSVTVYFDSGSLAVTGPGSKAEKVAVQRGKTVYAPAEPRTVTNGGAADLRYVRVEFTSPGHSEMWGRTGLAPNYKVLLENQYARAYDIRIPAHTNEPQHTHHDRVVVCLSGAVLKHRFPDGREEPSTLKSGETAWRRGSTHVGQNQGDTDLWVIAIEPK